MHKLIKSHILLYFQPSSRSSNTLCGLNSVFIIAMKIIKGFFILVFHLFVICLLTLSSQIGGLIWFVVFLLFFIFKPKAPFLVKFVAFIGFYLICILYIVPPIAGMYGKVPLPSSKKGNLIPHNPLFYILNRNYVTPKTREILLKSADRINEKNADLKLVYLDTSFPFSKEMPLPPHISHSNGRKVDLTYAYKKDGKLVNHGSSYTGYGNFEGPRAGEYNQPEQCLKNGHKLYDYSKFAGFGKKDVEFDLDNTRLIINTLLENPETSRILIEPHLKERMGITSDKVRFAGCWAVRHDDHIHFQIRR